jgi:eukaryotic-like serine/threonine-protein kinase
MARSASKPGIAENGTRFSESGVDGDAERLGRRLGVGSVIDGKYRLERLLGEGGMGTVWRAQHLQLDLPVAIKLVRAGGDQANLSERFKLEARAVARLTHPAIVRVFDIDTTESGEPFIVMELLEGESLSDLLDRERLSGVVAVQTLLPIAEGLALAHAKGIVHRDLKPHNVFIVRDGERVQPKLLDFGIAKLTTSPLPTGSLTDTGVLLGSPDYMSPEQARGRKDIDFRADIWQFCVVLFESIAGATPFEGENYNALMRAIVEDEPRPLPLAESVDRRLSELVSWGLAKDRSKRPVSVQELACALAEWLLERGVNEDITGAPLAPKWITRPTQKSLPLLQPEAEPEPQQPSAVRTDTLLSPRLPPSIAERSASVSAEPASLTATGLPVRWAIVALLFLLGGSLVWALMRQTAGQRPTLQPALSASVVAAPTPLPPPVLEVAPTAPQPASANSTSSAAAVNSASPAGSPARSSKSGVSKPLNTANSAASAAKPTPVKHDETRELLQAY